MPARIEALAALGGLGRDAVHSQLVAAIRVVLHMRREPGGRRRLAEVGVLRAEHGRARVVPVWRGGRWTVDRHLFVTSGAIAC